jgi:hypothetical protein
MGADALSNRITALQAKLNIEQTDEGRIALVGCEKTVLVPPVSMVLVPSALTSICVVLPVTSALMVPLPLSYNRFATDCAKEVISAWDTDKGETTQRTEAVKSHSEKLENPLGGFDEYSKLLNELIQKEGKDGSVWYLIFWTCKCLSKSLAILSKFFVFRIPDSNTLVI